MVVVPESFKHCTDAEHACVCPGNVPGWCPGTQIRKKNQTPLHLPRQRKRTECSQWQQEWCVSPLDVHKVTHPGELRWSVWVNSGSLETLKCRHQQLENTLIFNIMQVVIIKTVMDAALVHAHKVRLVSYRISSQQLFFFFLFCWYVCKSWLSVRSRWDDSGVMRSSWIPRGRKADYERPPGHVTVRITNTKKTLPKLSNNIKVINIPLTRRHPGGWTRWNDISNLVTTLLDQDKWDSKEMNFNRRQWAFIKGSDHNGSLQTVEVTSPVPTQEYRALWAPDPGTDGGLYASMQGGSK